MNAPVNPSARRSALDHMKVEDALESARDAARYLEALNAMGCSATGACQALTLHDVLALIGPAADMLKNSLRDMAALLEHDKAAQ